MVSMEFKVVVQVVTRLGERLVVCKMNLWTCNRGWNWQGQVPKKSSRWWRIGDSGDASS